MNLKSKLKSKIRLNFNANKPRLFVVLVLLQKMFSYDSAFAESALLSGVYVGSMHLVDGKERNIPLSVALTLTDETISTPSGLAYVIDGSFVVDDEGGPYTFTRVSYDIDNNRIDMKYSRPRMDPSTVSPASLRLVGQLNGDGSISGKVSSGIYGPIGDFKVARDDALRSVPHKIKYIGKWTGKQRNVKWNKVGYAEINLEVSARNTQNPPGYEFEFTPGRIGGYSSDGFWMTTFNSVVIDYLRRKIVMTDIENFLAMELDIDLEQGIISGKQTSSAYGLTNIFDRLVKVGR